MPGDSSAKKIYGLIGYPVKHSLSPAMHNAAFQYLKDQGKIDYDAEYRLFEIPPDKLESFLLKSDEIFEDTKGNSVRAGDILGFNITIPHKVPALLRSVAIVTCPEVLLAGAVNTVKRDNGKLRYYNTDSTGFIKSLQEDAKFDTKGKSIIVFGCGGAGRAVVAGLSTISGIKKIYLYDTNMEAAKSAQQHFSAFDFVSGKLEIIPSDKMSDKIKECSLLVNASPVGMKEGDGSVIDKSLLHEDLFVYDVVYNRETQLIKDAKSKGLKNVQDGLGMLLYQGVCAFELWTGEKAPVEAMRNALREAMSK